MSASRMFTGAGRSRLRDSSCGPAWCQRAMRTDGGDGSYADGGATLRARRIRHISNAAPGIRKPMLAGSGTTPDVLNVRLSKAKTVPPRPNPTMFGFSVPPDAEKSTSVTGPKLKVTSSFVVVLRVKFAVPTVVIRDFAV